MTPYTGPVPGTLTLRVDGQDIVLPIEGETDEARRAKFVELVTAVLNGSPTLQHAVRQYRASLN